MFYQEADDDVDDAQESLSEVSSETHLHSPPLNRDHSLQLSKTVCTKTESVSGNRFIRNASHHPSSECVPNFHETYVASDENLQASGKDSPTYTAEDLKLKDNLSDSESSPSQRSDVANKNAANAEENTTCEDYLNSEILNVVSPALNSSIKQQSDQLAFTKEKAYVKQTSHSSLSKRNIAKTFERQSNSFSELPRVVHSPVQKKHASTPVTNGHSEQYKFSPSFNAAHSWKTQAKISPEGASIVTVPCDGKANLLDVASFPLNSPLPTGVLEEPISGTRSPDLKNLHSQFIDFLQEREKELAEATLPVKVAVRKKLLDILQEETKQKALEQSGNEDQLKVEGVYGSTVDTNDDDGIVMYEEDSNDGMDRKLQEFEDLSGDENDDIENIQNGNCGTVSTNSHSGSNALRDHSNDATADFSADVSSEDNAYIESDSNGNVPNQNENFSSNTLKQDYGKDNIKDSSKTAYSNDTSITSKEDTEFAPENSRQKNSVGNVAWIVDGVGGIGATGTVFHLRLVGSVEVSEEVNVEAGGGNANVNNSGGGNASKRPRKEMVTEAVTRLKVCIRGFRLCINNNGYLLL